MFSGNYDGTATEYSMPHKVCYLWHKWTEYLLLLIGVVILCTSGLQAVETFKD